MKRLLAFTLPVPVNLLEAGDGTGTGQRKDHDRNQNGCPYLENGDSAGE